LSGGALIFFGLSRVMWLSLVLMIFVGFGLMKGAAVSNTVIQSFVPEDKRARVMGYYTMAFFGAAPFGSLLAGAMAHRMGAPSPSSSRGRFASPVRSGSRSSCPKSEPSCGRSITTWVCSRSAKSTGFPTPGNRQYDSFKGDPH
jgi:MFS family permease